MYFFLFYQKKNMEKNSEINLLEAQEKTNYLLNSKKLRKREKKKI